MVSFWPSTFLEWWSLFRDIVVLVFSLVGAYATYRGIHKWKEERDTALRNDNLANLLRAIVRYRLVLGNYRKMLDGLAGMKVQNYEQFLADFARVEEKREQTGGDFVVAAAEARVYWQTGQLHQRLDIFAQSSARMCVILDIAQVKFFQSSGNLEKNWLALEAWTEFDEAYSQLRSTWDNLCAHMISQH